MTQTVKEMAGAVLQNPLTWPRAVMIKYLVSYFRHSPEFNREGYKWDEDAKKTNIVIVDNHSDLSEVNESADRIIVKRGDFNCETISTDNRVKISKEMYTHNIVTPRLGYLTIYCESSKPVYSEYLASKVEMIILMHKELLLEWNLGIGALGLSEVRLPLSGRKFYSMMITVPTIIISEASYSVTDPQMLDNIEIQFGIGSAIEFTVKT